MKTSIAYIDDSQLNLDCVELILKDEFSVDTFAKPESFLKKYPRMTYAAILLDIHMPTLDGFALYEKIVTHQNYNGCPILFISSDESETARIRSLNLGAVDFISRQTMAEEMLARIKSRIQFFEQNRSIIDFGKLKVNLTLLKTTLGRKEVPLTFIELKLLCLVLRNYPDPVSKEVVGENVWKGTHVTEANLYSHVFNLNSKLEDWDHEVCTVKGKGLQLMKKDPA